MTPPTKRILSTKRMTSAQATTFITLQSVLAHQDADIMSTVAAMIQMGARAPTIIRLTGLPAAVIKRLCERENPHATKTGRNPTTISKIFSTIALHIEASLFLRFFAGIYLYEARIDAGVLVEAMRLYRQCAGGEPQLRFELAQILAEEYVARSIVLKTCSTCSVRYIMSVTPIPHRGDVSRGVCPFCRMH